MTQWRVVAVAARALSCRPTISDPCTHARGHADYGLHVDQGYGCKVVLSFPQPLRAGRTLNRVLSVHGWAGRAVAASVSS